MKTKAMTKFIAALMLLCPMFGIASCEDSNAYVHSTGVTGGHTEDDGSGTEDTENPEQDQNDEENREDMEPVKDIVLTIGGSRFTAVLEDNAAAEAFAAMLPMDLLMEELNGNEKYHYLDESLPVSSERSGTIREGDLMLWGSSCIVLFYGTFQSSYSYTRLGRIENPEGLAEAVGSGSVQVSFSL